MARWRAGCLEYVGRSDSQVKVRGFRIELGEIEAALAGCPGVGGAVAGVSQPPGGAPRLVAWVVPAAGAVVSVPEVRERLAGRLPGYMVPAVFEVLAALPLTVTGKVDRRALPEPRWERPELEEEFAVPATAAEEAIAGIWRQVLGLDRVGARDDFFDLGGDSLMAAHMILAIRRDLAVDVPIRAVFAHPTPRSLAAALAALAPDTTPPIKRADGSGPLLLSFGQQRLWFLDQLDAGSAEYLVPVAVRLSGVLDAGALAGAVAGVAARHEVLGSHVEVAGGVVVQAGGGGGLAVRREDVSGLPAGVREARAGELAAGVAGEVFDLGRGPLVRALLVRLAADDHLLVMVFHHMVFDGWSEGILAREVSALYAGLAAGREAVLAPLPVQYADYALWQREWLEGERLEGQLEYWRGQLAGVMPAELPGDRPRPPVRDPRGGVVEFGVPAALGALVREAGRAARATPFMVLLAVFDVLVSRYTGLGDVVVGTPVAGRRHGDAEGLIGFFVNTLVLRSDVSGDPVFAELLGRVRETALDAFAHQDVPFERLVEELAPGRDLSMTPLFQVMFVLQNAEPARWELPGVSAVAAAVREKTSKFDLTLELEERPDGSFSGEVEYAASLFDAVTVERLAGHYLRLLESVAAGPGARLSELEMLSAAERRELVAAGSGPRVAFGGRCVHELFAERAREAPGAPAVTDAAGTLSYGELDAASDRLAWRLRAAGAGPESLVAVCMERGAGAVVAMVAVLKAGGAYVPLDPGYPAERLAVIVAEAGPVAVLAEEATAGLVPAGAVPVIVADREEAGAAVPGGAAGAVGGAGEPGLRDLHLGVDRDAEGGDDHPPGAG